MVAIAESFREQWERESERREIEELERLARWLLGLRAVLDDRAEPHAP